ncbi:MAG: glutaredoxin family protein [Proteobacteria bacterium]|nr:glutaredoxin family protein [Pseudomonadota bacterium]
MQIELYGTACCHLCDEAKAVLHRAGVMASYIDIADDDGLLEKYGIRIPVLRRVGSGAELGWPFDQAAVTRFLA